MSLYLVKKRTKSPIFCWISLSCKKHVNAWITRDFSPPKWISQFHDILLSFVNANERGHQIIMVASFAYSTPVNCSRKKSVDNYIHTRWRKWIVRERNKEISEFWGCKIRNTFGVFSWNLSYVYTGVWVQIQSMVLKQTSLLSPLVHIVEWAQEYMNPTSFGWTCTRQLSHTSVLQLLMGIQSRRPEWV